MSNKYINESLQDIEILESLSEIGQNGIKIQRVFQSLCRNNYVYLEHYHYENIPAFYSRIDEDDEIRSGISAEEMSTLLVRLHMDAEPVLLDNKSKRNRTQHLETSMINQDTDLINYQFHAELSYQKLCIGVGEYKTKTRDKIYMCVLIDLFDLSIVSLSFGMLRSYEIIEKALYELDLDCNGCDGIIVHSSQNRIYQTDDYNNLKVKYHFIPSMTMPGRRGGIAPVSLFFSTLKRKMGGRVFEDVQDGIDWLENYIFCYNLKKCRDASYKFEKSMHLV